MDKLTDAAEILDQVGPGWKVRDGAIEKSLRFDDFAAALEFVNRVGEVAEELGHHPDITLRWDTVTLSCRTHFVGAITEYDIALCNSLDALDARGDEVST